MPLIDVQVREAVFSIEEKQALIKELAMAFGKVAGKPMQDNTSVRIHEVRSGHWVTLNQSGLPKRPGN